MKYGQLIIEKKEFELLKRTLAMTHYHKDRSYKRSISKFHQEIGLAKTVSNRKMPDDIIRFNSVVTIETPWNVKRSYQVVTPDKSDLARDRISVVAPMGLALFGYAKGDEIEWQFPMGTNIIKILDVVQTTPSVNLEKT